MLSAASDIRHIGVIDRETDLFEGQYRVPDGIRYNSYVILDEKTAVMDAVDVRFTGEWLAKLSDALDGRAPDYLVVQHMEPDHSAGIKAFLAAYPEATVVANSKTFTMMDNFFGKGAGANRLVVANGGKLPLGRHELTFVMAPMVHWPEVMVSYDSAEKTLFSADAFGTFGSAETPDDWDDEARRYFIGIVGKYGAQVQTLLKTASKLDIEVICPLHGPVLTSDLGHYIGKYDVWSSYVPEEKGVLVAYTSVYGHTKEAALLLSELLRARGASVSLYDLARDDMSAAVADAFRYSAAALVTTTYNGDVFPFMRQFIDHLTERGWRNRRVGLVENGSWAPVAAKVMRKMLESSRDLAFTDTTVTIRSAMTEADREAVARLADELIG